MDSAPQIINYVINQRQSPALMANTIANRPNPGFIGRIFFSTDEAKIYRDTGTAWVLFGSGSGSSGFTTADNGLIASTATNVELGGTNLIKTTSIGLSGFVLQLVNNIVSNSVLYSLAASQFLTPYLKNTLGNLTIYAGGIQTQPVFDISAYVLTLLNGVSQQILNVSDGNLILNSGGQVVLNSSSTALQASVGLAGGNRLYFSVSPSGIFAYNANGTGNSNYFSADQSGQLTTHIAGTTVNVLQVSSGTGLQVNDASGNNQFTLSYGSFQLFKSASALGFSVGPGTLSLFQPASSAPLLIVNTSVLLLELTGSGVPTMQINDTLVLFGALLQAVVDPLKFLQADNSGTVTNVTLPSATGTAGGIVTTAAQTFAGVKTFLGNIITNNNITQTLGDTTNNFLAVYAASLVSNQTVNINTTAAGGTIALKIGGATKVTVANGGQLTLGAGLRVNRATFADVSGSMGTGDYLVAWTSLTATRTYTLAPAGNVSGQVFVLKDESGSASGTILINIVGTVNGAVNPTAINSAYGVYRFYSNGTAFFTM